VNEILAWEIFPKQDSIPADGFGNLIKLPMQVHQKSGKRSHFVDKEFQEIFPEQFETISKEHFPDVVQYDSPKPHPLNSDSEYEETTSTPPHNMEMMFQQCKVLRDTERGDSLTHKQRLFLGSQLKPFGEDGRKKLHSILSPIEHYDENITNTQWNSIDAAPQTCALMCKNALCANIAMAGGRSPIKFGYQKRLYPFIEKATSAYAYYDRIEQSLQLNVPKEILARILSSYGQEMPEYMPVLKVDFDVQNNLKIDEANHRFNFFTPTEYLVLEKNTEIILLESECLHITLLLKNLIPLEEEREHFLNWLAGIMQTRKKQLTA